MKIISIGAVLTCAAAVAAIHSGAFAQTAKDRTVEQYLCKDVVRESGGDRDVAVAFLHGFLLGKSGNSKFNLDLLSKQSSDFVERCLDNPAERALEAMSKVRN